MFILCVCDALLLSAGKHGVGKKKKNKQAAKILLFNIVAIKKSHFVIEKQRVALV